MKGVLGRICEWKEKKIMSAGGSASEICGSSHTNICDICIQASQKSRKGIMDAILDSGGGMMSTIRRCTGLPSGSYVFLSQGEDLVFMTHIDLILPCSQSKYGAFFVTLSPYVQ
jgi:hypothetical protein